MAAASDDGSAVVVPLRCAIRSSSSSSRRERAPSGTPRPPRSDYSARSFPGMTRALRDERRLRPVRPSARSLRTPKGMPASSAGPSASAARSPSEVSGERHGDDTSAEPELTPRALLVGLAVSRICEPKTWTDELERRSAYSWRSRTRSSACNQVRPTALTSPCASLIPYHLQDGEPTRLATIGEQGSLIAQDLYDEPSERPCRLWGLQSHPFTISTLPSLHPRKRRVPSPPRSSWLTSLQVLLQTTAVATGTMPLAAGLVGCVPIRGPRFMH